MTQPKGAIGFLLLGVSCLAAGCVLTGDSVLNATDKDLVIVIHSRDGRTFKWDLPAGAHAYERRQFGDEGIRYQKVEAYDLAEKKIAEFDLRQLPNRRGRFGKFVTLVVFDDAIYPVPPGFFGPRDNKRVTASARKKEIAKIYVEELSRERK